MKKLLPILCLTLLLVSCSGQAPTENPTLPSCTAEEAAQTLLETKAFSEQLEAIDADIAALLYGIEEDKMVDCAAYLSTGATAEECTFLIMEEEEVAQEAAWAFHSRVEEQIAALENYQPAEIAKLEKVVYGYTLHEKGYLVYLVVAEDADVAQDAVDGLIS